MGGGSFPGSVLNRSFPGPRRGGGLARRGLVRLADGVTGWTRGLFGTGRFFAAELTVDIVLRAETLHGIRERTDRLSRRRPLSSGIRDRRMEQSGINVVW